MSELQREIKVDAAWDRVSEGYGRHGVDITWYVKGPRGAIQFKLFTGWTLEMAEDYHDKSHSHGPMPADIGYHSYVPHYEGQDPISEKCPVLDDKPCYYDGSSLWAERYWKIMVEKGGDALWAALEDYYRETFA